MWSDDCEITAVEYEKDIADAYSHFFPNDKVIVGDAHKYLLEHFEEYDFIWASPPCPTHSVMGLLAMKYMQKVKKEGIKHRGGIKELEYPDMKLYQEIIFLKHFHKGKWVVENTTSYYDPLIKPFVSGNHYFWSNFHISNYRCESRSVSASKMNEKEKRAGFVLDGFTFKNIESTHKKDKVLNNCVNSKLGLHIFNCAFKEKQQTLSV